jgi:hypothetical protein
MLEEFGYLILSLLRYLYVLLNLGLSLLDRLLLLLFLPIVSIFIPVFLSIASLITA